MYRSYQEILSSTTPQELAEHPQRDHLLRMAFKEKYIIELKSTLSGDYNDYNLKRAMWRETMARPSGEKSRIAYLQSLSLEEREALSHLLTEVLYRRKGDDDFKGGIFYNHVEAVMAVGSSTRGDAYRDELENTNRSKVSPDAQQRIDLRGNDIDLMLCHTISDEPKHFSNAEYRDQKKSTGPHKHYFGTHGLVSKIHFCLRAHDIPYTFAELEKKDGTYDYVYNNELSSSEHKTYTSLPHFTINMPGIRPIHLTISRESGDNIIKREYLEGRSFTWLMGSPYGEPGAVLPKIQFQQLIADMNAPDYQLQLEPETLDEKLAELDQWKRSNAKRLAVEYLAERRKAREEFRNTEFEGGIPF